MLSLFIAVIVTLAFGMLNAGEGWVANVPNNPDQIWVESLSKADNSNEFTLGLSQGIEVVVRPAITVTKYLDPSLQPPGYIENPNGVYDPVSPADIVGKQAMIGITPVLRYVAITKKGKSTSVDRGYAFTLTFKGSPTTLQILRVQPSPHRTPLDFIVYTRKKYVGWDQWYLTLSDGKEWRTAIFSSQADENTMAKAEGSVEDTKSTPANGGKHWQEKILSQWQTGDLILVRAGKAGALKDLFNMSKIARDQVIGPLHSVGYTGAEITAKK